MSPRPSRFQQDRTQRSSGWVTRLLSRRWLGRCAFELELEKPEGFSFQPGQFIRILSREGGEARDYTMASSPREPAVSLCVQSLPEGRMSTCLAVLPPGNVLRFAGPFGYFVFRPSTRPPVFVATGTGIAPFRAMVLDGVEAATILHGMRESTQFYYREVFEQCLGVTYVPCLSGPGVEGSIPANAFRGRVTEYMKKHLPAGVYDFYLCGNSAMIRDAILLIDARFAGSRVLAEAFF